MLASTCSIRFFSVAWVKFLSRVFTALNLLPSIAATAWVNRSSLPAQIDELAAGRPDRRAVVLPEVGDGLEVRRQPPGQPHQLDVALGLPLQPPARRDLVDVAVDVDLQQQRPDDRPAARSPPASTPVEPQRPQVQLVDEHVDHPDRVLLRHVVIQILRKQNALPAILTLDEALHLTPRRSSSRIITQQAFSHSLGRKPKFKLRHYRFFWGLFWGPFHQFSQKILLKYRYLAIEYESSSGTTKLE